MARPLLRCGAGAIVQGSAVAALNSSVAAKRTRTSGLSAARYPDELERIRRIHRGIPINGGFEAHDR